MTNSNPGPVVLIPAADWQTAQLAKSLLAEEGIPVLLHGMDLNFADLGSAAHNAVSRPDVLVPHAAFDRAMEILDEAWGPDWQDE